MNNQTGSGTGGVIGTIFLLVAAGWSVAVLVLPHIKMSHREASAYRDAMYQILAETNLHRADTSPVLVPRSDSSLDIYVNRSKFESVPYPDREELAAAISDIWCSQVSSFLLPTVRIKDVQKGSTLTTRRCVFEPSPDVTGNYSGVVHNITVNVDSTFDVQLVRSSTGIEGCMQVALPLVGTGPVKGTLNARNFVIDLNASSAQIRFSGTRLGHSVTGNYMVTSNGQTGTFSLHQDIPRVDIGFDPNNCPR